LKHNRLYGHLRIEINDVCFIEYAFELNYL